MARDRRTLARHRTPSRATDRAATPQRQFTARARDGRTRSRAGDAASAAFHHAISRAFFVDGADIADIAILARYAADADVTEVEIRAARASRSFAHAIDASMRAASVASVAGVTGVTGVPAFGWAGSHAMSGMMEPQRAIAVLLR